MSAFADTSFLFAFYFPRVGSEQALSWLSLGSDSPVISSLVRYEFEQAVWFKVWLQFQGQPRGLNEVAAQAVLAAFRVDLDQGLWTVGHPDWERIVSRAESLTLAHTPRIGTRAMDLMHVATALEIGATELLTFDTNQRRVAQLEGLRTFPQDGSPSQEE